MRVYAIIPARSGSKGFKDKNIQLIDHKPLIAYSINFAKQLGCDKVICSTDSLAYKRIAESYAAEVPFLRSAAASSDTAMEQDILVDLYEHFQVHRIPQPDVLVWLRPTFVFRDLALVKQGIEILKQNPQINSVRTVCESEGRLYKLENDQLTPCFEDQGKSMIRRQDMGSRYKVFSTDIFRFGPDTLHADFLGRNTIGLLTNKICGLDIDDEVDFNLVKCLVESGMEDIKPYLF